MISTTALLLCSSSPWTKASTDLQIFSCQDLCLPLSVSISSSPSSFFLPILESFLFLLALWSLNLNLCWKILVPGSMALLRGWEQPLGSKLQGKSQCFSPWLCSSQGSQSSTTGWSLHKCSVHLSSAIFFWKFSPGVCFKVLYLLFDFITGCERNLHWWINNFPEKLKKESWLWSAIKTLTPYFFQEWWKKLKPIWIHPPW